MKALLLLLLRGYKLGISPYLGNNCRFYPSCSAYAAQAIEQHGSLKGSILTARRLCRCHPLHPGGFDPVPDTPDKHPEVSPSSASQDGCDHC
jgi:uncharacterized protein